MMKFIYLVTAFILVNFGCQKRKPPSIEIGSNPPVSAPPANSKSEKKEPSTEETYTPTKYSQLMLEGVLENGDAVLLDQNVEVSVQPVSSNSTITPQGYTGPISERMNFKSGFSYRIVVKVFEDNLQTFQSLGCRDNPDSFELNETQVKLKIQLCPVAIPKDKASILIRPFLKKKSILTEKEEVSSQ